MQSLGTSFSHVPKVPIINLDVILAGLTVVFITSTNVVKGEEKNLLWLLFIHIITWTNDNVTLKPSCAWNAMCYWCDNVNLARGDHHYPEIKLHGVMYKKLLYKIKPRFRKITRATLQLNFCVHEKAPVYSVGHLSLVPPPSFIAWLLHSNSSSYTWCLTQQILRCR